MNEPERDALLDAWLRRSSTLHEELAKLDRDEPPEELDRIVLERAHRAIRGPRGVVPLRQLRWALPVGLAATLILSFVLLLQMTPPGVNPATAPTAVPEDSREYRTLEAQSEGASEVAASAPPGTTSLPAESPARRAPAPSAAAVDPQVSARSEGLSGRSRAGESTLKSERSIAGSAEAVKTRAEWLAEIESLRARGLVAEAERELAAFRQAYPEARAAPATATPPDR